MKSDGMGFKTLLEDLGKMQNGRVLIVQKTGDKWLAEAKGVEPAVGKDGHIDVLILREFIEGADGGKSDVFIDVGSIVTIQLTK